MRIEDVFISLQTQIEEKDFKVPDDVYDLTEATAREEIYERNIRAHFGDTRQKSARRLSVNQALGENQRIVVLGDPGSGKTTLLKYIVLAYAENKTDKLGLTETRLPIFIRLYDYVSKREAAGLNGFSFTDYLKKYCTDNLQLRLAPDFFEQLLERGECCVCKLFVEKWYKARERDAVIRKERTEHLTNTIMKEERIKSLASNPLMLTIIALVHRIEAELPHERVKLYDKCVTTLVETWDKVRGIKTISRRRLLEKLAYWMHSQPGEKGRTREVREGTLRLQLAHFLRSDPKNKLDDDEIQTEVENFIRLVKTRSGLLVERGEDVYSFSHLTFQEYLAASDIEKRYAHSTDAIWEEIQPPKLHDAHWREVILLLLGALNRFEAHNSILVRKIFEGSDVYEPILHRYLFLCGQALSDRVEVDIDLREQIVNELLRLLLSNGIEQRNVLQLLTTLQSDPRARDGLLRIAEDENVETRLRINTAFASGQLGRLDEAVQVLLAITGDENMDSDLRSYAAGALGQLGNEHEAKKILMALAKNENLFYVDRYDAMSALRQLAYTYEPALNDLLVLIKDEKVHSEMRHLAAQALGILGRDDEPILKELLELARNEKADVSLRYSAALSLGQLGRDDEAVKILWAIVEDENVNAGVRIHSMRSFGILRRADETVINGLITLTEDVKADAGVRREAAEVLGQLGQADETILNRLQVLAMNEKMDTVLGVEKKLDASVRCYAAEALGRLGRVDKALIILLNIAGDDKLGDWGRGHAARALGELGLEDEAVLNGLRIIAGDETVDASVRRYAAEALGRLGQMDIAIKSLLAIARNENVALFVRTYSVRALGQLGRADEAILNGLLALAGDEKVDAGVRRYAADALKKLLG